MLFWFSENWLNMLVFEWFLGVLEEVMVLVLVNVCVGVSKSNVYIYLGY